MMNVCGVLVHAIPDKCDAVVDSLSMLAGVEVHHTAEEGRIVVTVEDYGDVLAIDTLTEIHKLDGIVAATLVYHQYEPASDEPLAH